MVFIPTQMEGKQIVGEALHPMEWLSSGFIRVAPQVTYKPGSSQVKHSFATPADRGPAPRRPEYEQYRGAPGWEELKQDGNTILRKAPVPIWVNKDVRDPSQLRFGTYSPQEFIIAPDKSYTEKLYDLYQPVHTSRSIVQSPFLQKEVAYDQMGRPVSETMWARQPDSRTSTGIQLLSTKTFSGGMPSMQQTLPTFKLREYTAPLMSSRGKEGTIQGMVLDTGGRPKMVLKSGLIQRSGGSTTFF